MLLGAFPRPQELFNGDTLFLQDFAQDMLVGNRLRDWSFPIAPFVFPDAVLSFPAAFVGWNNPPVYLAVYSYLQLAIGIAGVALIVATLPPIATYPPRHRCEAALSAGLIGGSIYWATVCAFGLSGWKESPTLSSLLLVILPQVHSGTYLWALFCYGLYLGQRRAHPSTLNDGVLLVCLVLGSAGNPLFLVMATLPITFSIVVALAMRQRPYATSRLRGVCFMFAAPATFLGGRLISQVVPHAPLSNQSSVSAEAAATAGATFVRGFLQALSVGDLRHWGVVIAAVCIASRLLTLRQRLLRRRIPAELHFIFLFAAAAILTPAALIVGGNNGLTTFNNYAWTGKYLAPLFHAPLIAAFALIFSRVQPHLPFRTADEVQPRGIGARPPASIAQWITLAVIFVCLACGMARAKAGLFNYSPPLVTDLKRNQELQGVDAIFAGFWPGRLINLFAAGHYKAYTCGGDLFPLHWLSSSQNLLAPEESNGRFAVLVGADATSGEGGITRQKAVLELGPPEKCVRLNDNWELLVYEPRLTDLCIYKINNFNYGTQENANGKLSTWIGSLAARVKIYSPTATQCTLSFKSTAGPALPVTQRRTLQVKINGDAEREMVLENADQVTCIPLSLPAGRSYVEFTCLDSPTHPTADVLFDPRKTRGALLLFMSEIRISTAELSPAAGRTHLK